MNEGSKQGVRPPVAWAVAAALLTGPFAGAAMACDCAFCGVAAKPDSLAEYNGKMEKILVGAVNAETALRADRPDRVTETVHGLVQRWLALHSAFYTRPPAGSGVARKRWQECLTGANALLEKLFRDARKGDLDAVGERLTALRRRWRTADRLLGIPEAYTHLRELRAAYKAYAKEDSPYPRSVRWAVLRDHLERAEPIWEKLVEGDRPEVFDRPLDPIVAELRRVRDASAKARRRLVEKSAERLGKRLATVDRHLERRAKRFDAPTSGDAKKASGGDG